jgi:hypothetical protein
MPPAGLLDQVKGGRPLSSEEVRWVARQLETDQTQYDCYTLLHLLGLNPDMGYRPLVERYLVSPTDPMLARLALSILCDWWSLKDEYVDTVVEFVDGQPWDEDGDARQVAIRWAGEIIREDWDAHRSLADRLLRIATDDAENPVLRDDATRALAIAEGITELPPAAKLEHPSSAWSRQVISEAQSRLG